MKIKEQVIRESMKRCEKRIKKLKKDIWSNPLSEAFEHELKTIECVKKMDSRDAVRFLTKAIAKKKRLMKKAEDQIDHSGEWIDELVQLEMEWGDLKNELWQFELKYS